MPVDIYIDGEEIKLVDGVQTTPRKLDEIVKGSHSAHKIRHQNGGADEIDVGGLSGELADNQPPKAHKTSHESGGGDAIKLDDLSAPDDNVNLNASITKHGLLPKLANDVAKFLTGLGTWIKPKLDDLDEPDDNTDLDASTTKHGLLPKMNVMITDLDADKVDGKNASDLVQMTGNQAIDGVKTFNDTPKMDAIAEITADTGVTVDGVLIKDSLDASNIVDKSSAQTITGQKTITSPLFIGILDGWIASGETWTYASATTFTITGDLTGKYQIGDKIKLTQTTVKYFSIIGISYSSPNTTITIIGGTDYSLVDASIISPYYSKVENPQGFPTWFTWTPTYGAETTMTYTSVSTFVAKFCIIGKMVTFMHSCDGTTGGTATTYISFTLPTPSADSTAGYVGGGCSTFDGGRDIANWINGDASIIRIYKASAGDWGLGATKRMTLQGHYRIA